MQWQWRIEIVSDSQLCVARPEVTVPTPSSGNHILLNVWTQDALLIPMRDDLAPVQIKSLNSISQYLNCVPVWV